VRKDVVIQDGAIIALEPANNGLTRLLTYSILGGKRSLVEVVYLTPDECAKLGSALYSVASTDKRRKAAEGAIPFGKLAIGQKFRFVNHYGGQPCLRIDNGWHNYQLLADGCGRHTSANAKVIPLE
jgi:hypothetical protein